MFPARAGMSLGQNMHRTHWVHVPRASGDEPRGGGGLADVPGCSPRERG